MIDLQSQFKAFKSIVCLNGIIPEKRLFTKYSDLPLIVTDGAANTLIEMGVIPSTIIGDLDSLNMDIVPSHIEVIYMYDQDHTDLQKLLTLIESRQLFPCLIYGATGKETDHTLYNLAVMEDCSRRHMIIFHDSAYEDKEKFGIFVSDGICGNLSINAKISIIAYVFSKVTTRGLNWDLKNKEMSPLTSSVRNIIRCNQFEICIEYGRVLILFDL